MRAFGLGLALAGAQEEGEPLIKSRLAISVYSGTGLNRFDEILSNFCICRDGTVRNVEFFLQSLIFLFQAISLNTFTEKHRKSAFKMFVAFRKLFKGPYKFQSGQTHLVESFYLLHL